MATTVSSLSNLTTEETPAAPATHTVDSIAEAVTKSPTEPAAESVAMPAIEPVALVTTVPTIEPAVETIPTTVDTAPPAIQPAAVIAASTDDATPGEHADVPSPEVVPVEEGVLEHKKTIGFPLNLIFREQTFWFGTGPTESKDLGSYLRNEKSYDVAHHNAAWASTTGVGLLFHGEKKGNIGGIINLADASEPETDGPLRFYLTHRGIKHTFRAQNTANRDNWVSQLKNRITSARASSTSVTDDSGYKTALDSYKSKQPISPLAKEDAIKSEDPKTDAKPDDGGSDSAEDKRDGRRSVSRKRLSVFFNRRSRKEDEKVEGDKTDEPSVSAESAAVAGSTEPAVTTPGLATETPTVLVSPTDAIGSSAETTTEQDKLSEDKKSPDPDATKSTFAKRNSLFGLLKRDRKAPPSPIETDTVESTDAPVTATETAPVIPPVDTATTPLAVELSSPATVPTEIIDLTPAATEKKEVKADKRKSSLPFAFAKKEKSPGFDDSSEKKDKEGVFSRIRNTIKRYPSDRIDKTEEKTDVTGDKSDIPAVDIPQQATDPTAEATVESFAPVDEIEHSTHDIPVTVPVTAAA